ncbi:MFS general substrate transporter [Dendrothele bispora CBS 962.96]|uniref:MFS general substrate transporter n=1 Tax=Dendrothele bispora (strain CBS 962.96) TaxID=1314807 RepID=A0A4S8L1H5_DENBC|nr:MFS general substrate transporter [Dendrothele bispora CBS 962.96]
MENRRSYNAQETLSAQDSSGDMAKPGGQEPYSIFTKREKWFIVMLIAGSGLFSPLTANIYFPAIPVIAEAFNKSIELINLTVTMYMIFQGVAPVFFGTLSDYFGRRIIYASCLAILSISCIGLALVPTDAYWLLMFLRCLQAMGSTSTIALGAGVIGDISEPFERGGFMGLYGVGPLVGPAIGPVIGGALTGSLGWRSIFWFLVISAGIACLIVILFLPETLRSIVDNGSKKPSALLRPVIPIIAGYKERNSPYTSSTSTSSETQIEGQIAQSELAVPTRVMPKRKFQNPVRLLRYPDIPLILLFVGTNSAVFYAVAATISSLFVKVYPDLTEIEIGLCFLCIGGGMCFGSGFSGLILDWEWKRVGRAYYAKKGLTTAPEKNDGRSEMETLKAWARDDLDFPVEYARLRFVPLVMVPFVASIMGYGWCLQKSAHIAAPLVLQFISGLTVITVFNAVQTYIVDLAPSQSSSVSACNNLFRGVLGAVLVAVIDLILNALDPGWTYVMLGAVTLALTPIVWVVIRIGPWCRRKRREL